jgi:DNA-binding LacI/PurR family transcriptional regulator
MVVTIKEIARLAGVTHPVVSAVLNGTTASRVSPEKRQKIQEIVKELNYRPNFAAKSLVRQRTHMLGFICGDIDIPYFSEITTALLEEAEIHGYRLMSLMTDWNHEKELERLNLLMDSSVDGIIMYSEALMPETSEYQKLKQNKFPLVLLENLSPGFAGIKFNMRPGMEKLFEFLLQTGHRRIATAHSVIDHIGKMDAYMHCCRKYGVELLEYSYPNDNSKELSSKWIAECASKIAGSQNMPDALVMLSDFDALIMISVLCKSGIKIPEDMSVTGIDGTTMSGFYNPPLTSILKDRKTMANMAINELLEQINNMANYQPRQLEIPTSLIKHDSVKNRSENAGIDKIR